MALVNVMSMFSQMASPVFVYSVGLSFLLNSFLSFNLLQSVLSEKAPFILIALVCFLGSIPGRKASYFILDFKQEKEGILINRTLSARDGWGESS